MLFADDQPEALYAIANRISKTLLEPFFINDSTHDIGSSIGIARYPRDADAHDSLIKAADIAMDGAKISGTNQIAEYNLEMNEILSYKAQTAIDTKNAINKGQFELYYQPQFNMTSGRIESVEALESRLNEFTGFCGSPKRPAKVPQRN